MRRRVIALSVVWLAFGGCGGQSVETVPDTGAGSPSSAGESSGPTTGGTSSRGGSGTSGGRGGTAGTGAGGTIVGTGGRGGATPETGGQGGTTAGMGGAGEGGTGGDSECDPNSIRTGDVSVSTQSALEELRGVTIMDGSLIVELAISSLEPLRCLKSVSGSLHFGDPYELRELDYLENLESVGGDLIFEATLVPDVHSLTGLRHVGGNLEIKWNLNLSDLDALSAVTSVGGNLVITRNDELAPCEAEELATAIGAGNIAGEISISDNSGTRPCP